MILPVNYEETQALRSGAETLLSGDAGDPCAVLALPEDKARVADLLHRLDDHLSFGSLAEVRGFQRAVETILECSRVEMEAAVLASHPADEAAVSAYFGFAHVLAVARRLTEMAAEMTALIEVVTGEPVTARAVQDFRFPD